MSVWMAGSCVLWTHSHSFFILLLSYFLPLHSTPGSSFVFLAPVLESDIYWRLVLETELWELEWHRRPLRKQQGLVGVHSLCVQNAPSAKVSVNRNPYYHSHTQHKVSSSIHLFLIAFSDINLVLIIVVSQLLTQTPVKFSNLYGFFFFTVYSQK